MSLVSFSLLVLAATGSAYVAPSSGTMHQPDAREAPSCDCKNDCTNTLNNATLKGIYRCGDPLLGPVKWPTKAPLQDLLEHWEPYAGQCPGAYLVDKLNPSTRSYVYPEKDGFMLDCMGNAIRERYDLTPGQLVDRFGPPTSAFLGDPGMSYEKRAITPKNLNFEANGKSPYHVYKVLKNLPVHGGTIRPAFGQPGGGYQYVLVDLTATSKALEQGYLTEIDLDSQLNGRCEPNETECAVNTNVGGGGKIGLKTCNADGSKWEYTQDCGESTTCKIQDGKATCVPRN
ncbi:hypothetical protein HRG_008343 [Hirsutella rhossiliensis]